MYIQLTRHQLLFKLGLANGLLMSVGSPAVTGSQQKWLLSIKITFPQVCCLNIPFPNLVTVTEWKTNSRTLESAVILKTLFLTLHSAFNRQPPSLAFRLVITKLGAAFLFTLLCFAEFYSFCCENPVSSMNVRNAKEHTNFAAPYNVFASFKILLQKCHVMWTHANY